MLVIKGCVISGFIYIHQYSGCPREGRSKACVVKRLKKHLFYLCNLANFKRLINIKIEIQQCSFWYPALLMAHRQYIAIFTVGTLHCFGMYRLTYEVLITKLDQVTS